MPPVFKYQAIEVLLVWLGKHIASVVLLQGV